MTDQERIRKMNQKFKNIYKENILSSTWDKEGVEVSYLYLNI